MSDASVHTALRSDAPLVVVEAPAGCGKTHQGAEYAKDLGLASSPGRPLILTHTHAARSVFAGRTVGSSRVDVRTIDSLVVQIAAAYHRGLGLPPDPVVWVRQRDNGYRELAAKVAQLLDRYPMIARAIACRHPVVVCDEHQDATGDQHAVVTAVLSQGARVRIFGDPLQKIFREEGEVEGAFAPCDWEQLKGVANRFEELDYPHRWKSGCRELGIWILAARAALKAGKAVDLRAASRPASVEVAIAENVATAHDRYQLSQDHREPIDQFVRAHANILILTRQNIMARGIRAFFNREMPLWEGHTRNALEVLVDAVIAHHGDAAALARDVVAFLGTVAVGFSPSLFGDRLEREASERCVAKRSKMPAQVQQLARCLVDDPTHRGVAKLLKQLDVLRQGERAFKGIKVDHRREYWDAVRLEAFEAPDVGLGEIAHRRSYASHRMPPKAISNIHKAKGLECRHAVVMPCSRATFPDTELARRLLYVALSRASHKLLIVASAQNPSPLLIL